MKLFDFGIGLTFIAVLLSACSFGSQQQIESQVYLSSDGETHIFTTSARNVAEILAEAEVVVLPGDRVLVAGLSYSPEDNLPEAAIYTIQIARTRAITLNSTDGSRVITSAASTLAGGLLDGGIKLSVSDRLNPPANTAINGPLSVTLTKARPIQINDGQHIIHSLSAAPTVGLALAEVGLSMQALDYSLPPSSDPLPEDGVISIVRVTEEVIIQQEPLPFESIFQGAPEVPIDTIATLQTGEYGITSQRVRIRYQDGVEISRQVEDEWISRQPQPRIQGYGTKITVQTMQTPNGPIEYWRAVEVYATSYAAKFTVRSPDDPRYGIMFNGKLLRTGYIAVLRSWYNCMAGGQYYIPNYGYGEVGDIGAGVEGSHWIDLGYSDDEYVAWHSYTNLYFLTPVPPPNAIQWILPTSSFTPSPC